MRTLGQPANASHPSTRGTLPSPGKQGGGGVGAGEGAEQTPDPKTFRDPSGGCPPPRPLIPSPTVQFNRPPPGGTGTEPPGLRR